jgi:hypothetical protein
MTLNDTGTVVGLIVGILGILGLLCQQAAKQARMEVKIDTLWDFQMRRGAGELVAKGHATVNSPIVLSEEAKKWMHELAEELKKFYSKLGRHLSDRDLAFEIERRYGDDILKKVCIPNGISEGACLIIAMEVAKEINET